MKVLHAVDANFFTSSTSSPKQRKPRSDQGIDPYLKRIEQILSGLLDHSYTLLYHISLAQGAVQSPLALLSPSGITLFFLDHQRGVFRVQGGKWEKLDERRNQYDPSQPDPLMAASAQANALRLHLVNHGFPNVNIQTAVVFTDPGVHIQAEDSEVRLIYMDAFPRFAANLKRAQPTLTLDEVHALVPILAPYTLEEALRSREIQDDFSFREEKPRQINLPQIEIPLPPDDKLVKAIHKVPFSQRQLLIIGVLVVINILVLIALVLVILAIS